VIAGEFRGPISSSPALPKKPTSLSPHDRDYERIAAAGLSHRWLPPGGAL